MGFGTLFIGYFLLLNIFNFGYSDLIASLIMMLGAYKLSSVGADFKKGFFILIPFAILGAYELVFEFISLFPTPNESPIPTEIIGMLRCAFLGTSGFFFASGIKKLAEEVELPRLRDKAKNARIGVIFAYSLAFVLEIPSLDKIIPTKVLMVISLLSLVATFAVTVYILTAIYSAYMRICMPEDLLKEETPDTAFTAKKRKKGRK